VGEKKYGEGQPREECGGLRPVRARERRGEEGGDGQRGVRAGAGLRTNQAGGRKGRGSPGRRHCRGQGDSDLKSRLRAEGLAGWIQRLRAEGEARVPR
jgi:hypothetical protein